VRAACMPVLVTVATLACVATRGRATPPVPPLELPRPAEARLLTGRETIRLRFQDAALVTGQPCLCVAGGFEVVRLALPLLTGPDGRLPARGEIGLVASRDHAVADVVAFLVGAVRREDPGRSTMRLDPTLSPRPGTWVFVLVAPGTERAARVTWDRTALWTEDERRRLAAIEKRAEHATPAERRRFREAMAHLVRAALAGKGFSAEPLPLEEALVRWPDLREALSR